MSNERTPRYHVKRREFLDTNLDDPACIIGVVEDTSEVPDENEDQWKWGVVQLKLYDGSDHVWFNFYLNDPGARAASLRQINVIAEVVNAVRDAIAAEVDSRSARPHVLFLMDAAVA
jgi:hypothetical protein